MQVNVDQQLYDYQHSSKYILYVQHKKETYTSLERHDGK